MSVVPRTLVVISWDGTSKPLSCLDFDTKPEFELLLFDYSGTIKNNPRSDIAFHMLSYATECKGQIFLHLANYFATMA